MATATSVAGGWHVIATLDLLECLTGRWPPVVQRASKRGHSLIRRISHARAINPLSALTEAEDGHVQLLEIDAVDRLADIAARASSRGRLSHVRDEEYFRWRLANPLGGYQTLASQDAYLILQWSSGGSHVNLVDWRASDMRSLASVLNVALPQTPAVRVWDVSLDSELRSILESFGALMVVHGPSFLLRTVTDDPQDVRLAGLTLNEPANWDLRMIDSDEF
jgi:hypothetical protein